MPDWNDEIRRRLAGTALRPETEADVIAEMCDHLDDRYAELRARGMDDEHAVQLALEELEDIDLGARVSNARGRETPGAVPVGTGLRSGIAGVLGDVRLGARLLMRQPMFAATAIVTIGLALGVNTMVFGAIRSLMLRPLPYPEPDQVAFVHLAVAGEAQRVDTLTNWSHPKYAELLASQRVFEQMAGYASREVGFSAERSAERGPLEMATTSYFEMLGVVPQAGRVVAGPAEVMLSHEWWQHHYGGSRAILGSTIEINRIPFTVVGVAPPGFRGLSGNAVAWVSIENAPQLEYPEILEERGNHWFRVVGRIRSDVAHAEVPSRLSAAFASIQGSSDGAIVAVPLDARRVSPVMRRTILVLFAAALLVLMIACANIAGLLIARAGTRQQEIAVRLALGAGRRRVMRQLLAESMVLAAAGGAFGLLLAIYGTRLVHVIMPALAGDSLQGLLVTDPPTVDSGVLAFAFAAIALTGLLAGVLPALRASRTDLTRPLRDATPGSGRGRSTARSRAVLVTLEAAFAVVLLVGAGLMLRTFAHYRAINVGVDVERVLALRLSPLEADGYNQEKRIALYRDVAERIRALPGVAAVSVDTCLPLSGGCSSTVATRAGDRTFELGNAPGVGIHFVHPDHLTTLGIPLKHGRMLSGDDREGAPRAVVISESAARSLFGTANPVGKRIQLATAYMRDDAEAEVVGVVGDVLYDGITDPAGPVVYAPALQYSNLRMHVLVRAHGDPRQLAATVRDAVREVAPNVPVPGVATLNEHLGDVLARTRWMAVLLTAFALFALLLAITGVFGIIALGVQQRRSEIGLRIAIGARPATVAAMVAVQGFGWFALGALIGLPVAVAASMSLRGLLYEIAPTDGTTYVIVMSALLAAGALGAWIPARRAARVDPCTTLRSQ